MTPFIGFYREKRAILMLTCLAPGVWSDFAWPDKMKAIEVWGGIHDQDARQRMEPENAEARMQRDSERIQKAVDRGWTIKVVMAHELTLVANSWAG